jgi:hypothetical protein
MEVNERYDITQIGFKNVEIHTNAYDILSYSQLFLGYVYVKECQTFVRMSSGIRQELHSRLMVLYGIGRCFAL